MEEVRREADSEEVIDLAVLLSDMWRNFRRLWWMVLLLVAAGAAGFSLFWSLYKEPLYACSATFAVAMGDEDSGSYNFYYNQSTADQLSKTFPYLLESNFFQSALKERLGKASLNGSITAQTIKNSNVVTMRAESPSGADAQAILEAALAIYPETARFVLGDIRFQMLDEPEAPTAPYNGKSLAEQLAIGGIAGLLAALCILGLESLLRKTARNPEEMKRVTSLRCLAMVPQVQFKARRRRKNQRIAVLDERTPYGYRESMRALKLRVEKSLKENGEKALLVTSAAAGEGKSTVAVNLAQLWAAEGKRVLLIDGDLRKQKDAALLGIKGRGGLAEAATGNVKPEQLIGRMKKSGLHFLCGSRTVNQPASLLSSAGVRRFMAEARQQMDFIVIDTPPCGMFQDAGILAEYADGILYVVKYDCLAQRQIREGLSYLEGRKAAFLGYAFNDYPEAAGKYGYGRYGYGYGQYGRGFSDRKAETER